MSVSEFLQDVFVDALFGIINANDSTKALMFNLDDAAPSTTMTIKSSQTDNRTLALPDRDGTLSTEEEDRSEMTGFVLDYSAEAIRFLTMHENFTLTIDNPIQGKMVLLEVLPEGRTLSFPPSCRILSGRFKATVRNYVYFHCIDDETPTYVVTIGQQIA